MNKDERLEKYPKTEKFEIIDTIGMPHPYCITSEHVVYASDHCSGMLGKDAIIEAEKTGAKCGICKGKLKYDEHKTALLVQVDDKRELKDIPEIQKYLLECKPLCEADGFEGFSFIRKK